MIDYWHKTELSKNNCLLQKLHTKNVENRSFTFSSWETIKISQLDKRFIQIDKFVKLTVKISHKKPLKISNSQLIKYYNYNFTVFNRKTIKTSQLKITIDSWKKHRKSKLHSFLKNNDFSLTAGEPEWKFQALDRI